MKNISEKIMCLILISWTIAMFMSNIDKSCCERTAQEVYTLDKDFFFSKYKDLKELVFYRVENDKVKVKIAIPKYKEYILKILEL